MIVISEYTQSSYFFWYSFGLSFSRSEGRLNLLSLLSYNFLLLSCLHLCSRNALLTSRRNELDGYNQEFWKTLEYYLKCVLQLVTSTSHVKVPSKASLWTGLLRTSSSQISCRKYQAVNRIYARSCSPDDVEDILVVRQPIGIRPKVNPPKNKMIFFLPASITLCYLQVNEYTLQSVIFYHE